MQLSLIIMYILWSYGNEPQNAVRGKCLLRNTMLIQCCISHFFLHLLSDPSPIIGYACYSLTHSLLFSKLYWCDVWLVKMPTQNLRLLLLPLLMMRIVIATVCCRFGSWGLIIKLNFCSDFEHKILSRFWNWSSGEILKLKFAQYFAADVWLRLRIWTVNCELVIWT